MIGKGSFFDLISRTGYDVNNIEIPMNKMIENFRNREQKFLEIKAKYSNTKDTNISRV